MTSLAELYTPDWFRARRGYRSAYRVFAEAMYEVWRPGAVLDLGCGAGYIVEWFAERGIPALGVDGSAAAQDVQPPLAREHSVVADLTRAPALDLARWPFVVCIEVAEHLRPADVDTFMQWFRRAERVFFTAAPPGQGGLCHFNEQPAAYWVERFEAQGLRHEPAGAARWQHLVASRVRGAGCPWVRRNAMLFARSSASE